MLFEHKYSQDSKVSSDTNATNMSFAPDTKRKPTFFSGELGDHLPFREAISALHDVVISDLRFKPKDKSEYLAWRAQQDDIDWAGVESQRNKLSEQIKQVAGELSTLRNARHQRMTPYFKAQRQYFDYIYKKDYNAWFVLDPVITIHPDEVFFECFSQDESSYGKLSVSYEVFKDIGEFQCGTTNIDYSDALYKEFQKIRRYRATRFEIDPSGFELQTENNESYKEVKIDLPDSWVRGFLQVSSAMSMPMAEVVLHPTDVANICFILRRNKEKKGPRSIRWQLEAGKPVKAILEPWNITVNCPRSIYKGSQTLEVRVWGRRRIHILERLVPIAKSFKMYLLGTGMPSFYVADLGNMSFTLGLSGWTANDWSQAGNFDLLAPRAQVDSLTGIKVFEALRENWREPTQALAKRLKLSHELVLGALGTYTQAGRAIYDLSKGVYRVRELTQDPLPMDSLRWSNPREEKAQKIVEQSLVRKLRAEKRDDKLILEARVGKKKYETQLTIDGDEKIVQAHCTCNWHIMNKLFKGPCEHIIATRIAHREDKGNFKWDFWHKPKTEAHGPQGRVSIANDTADSGALSFSQAVNANVLRSGIRLFIENMIESQYAKVWSYRKDELIADLFAKSNSAKNCHEATKSAVDNFFESNLVEEISGTKDQASELFYRALFSARNKGK